MACAHWCSTSSTSACRRCWATSTKSSTGCWKTPASGSSRGAAPVAAVRVEPRVPAAGPVAVAPAERAGPPARPRPATRGFRMAAWSSIPVQVQVQVQVPLPGAVQVSVPMLVPAALAAAPVAARSPRLAAAPGQAGSAACPWATASARRSRPARSRPRPPRVAHRAIATWSANSWRTGGRLAMTRRPSPTTPWSRCGKTSSLRLTSTSCAPKTCSTSPRSCRATTARPMPGRSPAPMPASWAGSSARPSAAACASSAWTPTRRISAPTRKTRSILSACSSVRSATPTTLRIAHATSSAAWSCPT